MSDYLQEGDSGFKKSKKKKKSAKTSSRKRGDADEAEDGADVVMQQTSLADLEQQAPGRR